MGRKRESSRPGVWPPLITCAALASVFLPGPAACAGCPGAVVQIDRLGTPPFPVESDVYDTTFADDANSAHVAFDRSQAVLSLSANSSGRLSVIVRLLEAFDITGVPPGTSVDATLEFRVDGWAQQSCGGAGCGVRFEGWLVVEADSVFANANEIGPGYVRHDIAGALGLPVTFVAGSPIAPSS